MADIKFSEFPKATQSKDSDEIAILQDGVNKMIPSPVLESKIINKTTSRILEEGGISLNLINPIGVVPTYADLALITPTPELNDAYQVEADGLVYVYTENGFQLEGEGFIVQPEPTGVVEEGNVEAVSGGVIYNSLQPIYNEIEGGNFLVGNSGDISTYSVNPTQEYVEVNLVPSIVSGTINEIKLNVSKIGLIRVAVFKDETPDGASLKTLRNMGEVELNCEVLGVNIFTDFGELQIEEGWYLGVRKLSGGALPYATIKANGCARAASVVVPIVGDDANMGVHNYEFAIEAVVEKVGIKQDIELLKLEFEDALKLEDLDIKYSDNLLNPENRILDQYIDSAGNIITGVTGWELAFIDVSSYPVGQEITFNGMNIGTGHAAWYNESTKLAYAGSYTTASQPITYVKPENATLLYITTMRGGVVNPEVMVNLGAEALPYVPYEDTYVEKIAGFEIKGGSGTAYNQSLNTTDNVKFQSLEMQAFKAFLPTSDVGLEAGDVWVDTANSNVLKVK